LGEQAEQMKSVVEDLVTLVGGTGGSNGLPRQSLAGKLREGWRSRLDRKSQEKSPRALEGGEDSTPLVTHEAAPRPGKGRFKDY
jgi:hypothetical protein